MGNVQSIRSGSAGDNLQERDIADKNVMFPTLHRLPLPGDKPSAMTKSSKSAPLAGNDISNIKILTQAIESGRHCQAFSQLLESVLERDDQWNGQDAPLAVFAHENNPGRLPVTNDIHGPRGTNFSCVTVSRFILVLGGSYRVVRDLDDHAQDRIVRAGEFYWIRPNGWNLVRNDTARTVLSVIFEQDYTRFLWYHHQKETVSGSRRDPGAHTALRYHTHAPACEALRHAVSLMDAASGGDAPPTALRLTARTLLAWCLHELRLDASHAISLGAAGTVVPSQRTFAEIRAYVGEHLQGELNREQVAGIFRISEDHLTRLFRIHAQCGFIEFVRMARLQLAERLLETSRLSVKEVSVACGFNLSEYFIKRFKEKHGVPPTKWRRLHAEKAQSR